MSEEIVACTGCGKKFRIPQGSPAAGSFACTACGADVAWGGAGGSSGGGGGRKKAGSRKAGGAQSRGARRARGRKTREPATPAAAEDGGGRRGRPAPEPKENKTAPLIIALMGIVLLAGGLIVAFTGEKPDYDKEAAAQAGTRPADAGQVGGISSSNTPDPAVVPVAPTPGAGTQPISLDPDPESDPDDESGIGESRGGGEEVKGYRYWYLRDDAEIFKEIDPVEGTSDAEATEFRRLAALATDFDSGSEGMSAERALSKSGRKAIPFLLSVFAQQYNGGKWAERGEQFGAFKIQQLCREITKADGPPSDFIAKFSPQGDVPPQHFQRAGKMWIAWWLGEGQFIEEFKRFEDEE